MPGPFASSILTNWTNRHGPSTFPVCRALSVPARVTREQAERRDFAGWRAVQSREEANPHVARSDSEGGASKSSRTLRLKMESRLEHMKHFLLIDVAGGLGSSLLHTSRQRHSLPTSSAFSADQFVLLATLERGDALTQRELVPQISNNRLRVWSAGPTRGSNRHLMLAGRSPSTSARSRICCAAAR